MGKIVRLTETDLTRLVRRVIKEQENNSRNSNLDNRVNDLVSDGYKIVPKFDLPDGEYNLGGSGYVCYINKDGKRTGYLYVTTGGIRGVWDKHKVEIMNGQINKPPLGEVYKILFNQSQVEK